MREWQIGDPVDDVHGAFMDAQNWGRRYEDDEPSDGFLSQSGIYSDKAWSLHMDGNDDEALRYIDMALDLNDRNYNDWNRKAIILESINRFYDAEKCYNRSLELSSNSVVADNKARMLKKWAANIVEISKGMTLRLDMLEGAKNVIIKAINSLPGESKENLNDYLQLRDTIDFYIGYEKRFNANIEQMKKYDRGELFTITGVNYQKDVVLAKGMSLRLVKEPDNEFDSDAIAVYAGDKKIGYVANSDYTAYEMTSKASDIHSKIPDECPAEYMFHLERYSQIQYYIGRIIFL